MWGDLPIGTDTPTNFPRCNAGPVLGTKFPRMMPMAMAKRIHSARKRSSNARFLKADSLGEGISSLVLLCDCCSMSRTVDMGGVWSESDCSLLASVGV